MGLQCGYDALLDLFYAVDRAEERHDFGRVGMLHGKLYTSTQHKAMPYVAHHLELYTKRDRQSALAARQFKHRRVNMGYLPRSVLAEFTSLPGAPVTLADLRRADEIFGLSEPELMGKMRSLARESVIARPEENGPAASEVNL